MTKLSPLDYHTTQSEKEMWWIILLQKIINHLLVVFTNVSKVIKSYVLAANVLGQLVAPNFNK